MIINFTGHALSKVKERGALQRLAEVTLSSPEKVYPSHGRLVAYKKFGSRYLLVVHERGEKEITVVTVFWREDPHW